MKTGRLPGAGRPTGRAPGSAAGERHVVPVETLQQRVKRGLREIAAADEEVPDRLLSGLLKGEHRADLKRGEQLQAPGGCAGLLVGATLREQQPHLGIGEVAPAPADLVEAVALTALPDQSLDEGREGDDAGMIEVFAEPQASPRDCGGGAVVAMPLSRGARGARSRRPAVRRISARLPVRRRRAEPRTAAEMLLKQPVRAAGFDETFGVPVPGRLADDPIRVGLEGHHAPCRPEPRFLEMAEKRGVEFAAEEYATGLEKLGAAGGVHGVIIGENGFGVAGNGS